VIQSLLCKHVLSAQSDAEMQRNPTGHPDINKQHVQLFFICDSNIMIRKWQQVRKC
jgi:hypothetical protein